MDDYGLTVEVRQEPGHVLVTVAGEVDIATVPQLRERLAAPAASGRPLIVDLDWVTFLDAAGLGVLARAASRAAAHGGQPACGLRTAPGPAALRHHRPGPPDTTRPHCD
jgi:anti-anti-sigma factor